MQYPKKDVALMVLRWIAALPAALLASIAAYYIVVVLNLLASRRFGEEGDFLDMVWLQFIGNAALGAGFVYVGAFVAPFQKRIVSVVFAGIVLFLSGALAFMAFCTKDLWAGFAILCLNLGAIAMAASIFTGEIKPGDDMTLRENDRSETH